jgi:regulator of nucleoside diphosphate kinase
MTKLPRCYLSVRDFHVLEKLIDGDILDPFFYRLVRKKITSATISAHGAVEANVETIGSRVDFLIDGQLCESLILVADEGKQPSRLTLPVTTLRGLALLGLRSGDEIVIDLADGREERLRLQKVYQGRPEQNRGSVVMLARPPAWFRPDDDDPGPRAA